MRRLTILGAFVLALAVAATAAAKPPSKPARASKPTITKTQAPKGSAAKGATIKGSASKGSTVKTKGAQAKASGGKSVKLAKASKGSIVKAKGAQAKASGGKSVKLAKADAKAAKATVKADAKMAKAERKATKKTNVKSSDTSSAASSTTSTSTDGAASGNTNTSTDAIDYTATALGQKLQKNGALRSKIEAKLLAAGYTGSVYEAAYGFKNLGQFNAATNQVQNHGYSFELLKVLMTGTYVDPETHLVYRATRLPDGTVQLVSPELATSSASTLSLGQAKQAIAAGAVMPEVVLVETTGTPATGGTPTAIK